jgi:CDGSH-type Zn-finger protein
MTRDADRDEQPAAENVIRISPDGPLEFRGQIEIEASASRAAFADTHAALCRCGASQNKPFCDGSHSMISFRDAGLAAPGNEAPVEASPGADGHALKISPRMNGPLHLQGSLQIENAGGEVIFRGSDAWLCRCGASKNKPFCDGSHKAIAFRSGEGEGFPHSRGRT